MEERTVQKTIKVVTPKSAKKMSATAMKDILWETLTSLREGEMSCKEATAIGSLSKEILGIIKTEVLISRMSQLNVPLSDSVKDYAL